MSRPAQPFTAEVVEVVEGAWVAIWSRLLPAEPVPGPVEAATYVRADDAQALEKARAEAVAHAQAKLQTWNHFWSLGKHSTPEKERWYAERAAREAEREAAAAAERAALTSDEIAAEEAEVAAGWAAWEAQKDRERDEQIAKRIAEADAEIDAVEGPGAGARRRAERDASYQRWVDSLAAEDAECERRQRELDEEYGPEEEPQATNGHLNGAEVAFRPPERVTPVSEPEEDPEARRERQRAENATIGDEEPGSFNMPDWKLEEFLAYCFALDTDKPSVAYVVDGRVSVRLMPTFTENFSHCKMIVGKGKPTPTTTLWRGCKERQFLAGATHSVGFPMIMEDGRLHGGQRVINTWAPKPLVEVYHPGLKDFTQHLAFIFCDRADEVTQWLAHCEQKPWELPHLGWLSICETHGIGRNWIASVLTRVWAGEVAASLDLGALVGGSFNNRISGKRLAVVDEINLSGSVSRHTIMAKRRQLMTEEVRRINGKFAVEHDEINVLRWLIFSNHADAMPLDAEDRRDEVVFGPVEPKAASYYTRLYGLLKDARFIQAVRWYLGSLDISGYNHGQRATLTGDKKRAIKAGRSAMCNDAAEWIEDNPKRTFATKMQMVGDDHESGAQQWKHVVRELKLVEVRCGGQRKHSVGLSSQRKVYMVRQASGWGITLAEPGLVDLDPADRDRMLVEVREAAPRRRPV